MGSIGRMRMTDSEEFDNALKKLSGRALDRAAKMALYDGMKELADELKGSIPEDSGDLKNSMGVSHIGKNEDKYVVYLGFHGYDSKGVPNKLKARVQEKKKPFFGPATKRAKSRAKTQMKNRITMEISK